MTNTNDTQLFRSSPERIGLAFGDEDGLWQIEFDDCNGVTWYESDWHKNYAPVSVAIEYVRLDVYENLKVESDSFTDDVEKSNRKNLSFAMACVRDEVGITVGGALNRQREMIGELRAELELQTQIAADANAQLNEARRLLAESEFPEELFSTHDVYTGSGRSYDAVIDVLDTVVRMIRKRKDAAIAASKGG